MTLSGEQRRAVERTGQDVCVVAGPGSGKTRVLVERFRWLVEAQGLEPGQILAITFTEKAATEIRQRLADAFRADPRRRTEVERAYVSTIHGFCARLLKENAIEAGLDPEFTVLSEPEQLAGPVEAAEAALDHLAAAEPAALERLLATLEGSPDLAKHLVELYDLLRSTGTPPDALEREQGGQGPAAFRALAEAAGRLPPLPASLRQDLAESYRALGESAVEAAALAGRDRLEAAHFRVLAAIGSRVEKGWGRSAVAGTIRDLKELAEQAEAECLLDWHARDRRLLAALVRALDARYRQAKRERGVVDFADLEELAIGLLERSEAVRDSVRRQFDAILMDELQDTNPLQWRLLDLIRSPGTFFAVGDLNQSIYGFRHARPMLFQDYRDGFQQAGLAVDELRDNYRSRPEILAAALHVLDRAPGVERHELRARSAFADRAEPSVEVILSRQDGREDAQDLEALWVARRICDFEGRLPLRAPGGGARPAEFRDMAVLVRGANAFEPLQRAFAALRVPYLISGGKTFFEVREVRDLLAWLRVLANPRDEVALVTLLRSPFVGLSDEGLYRLLEPGQETRPGNLAEALGGAPPGLNPADAGRLAWFRERLAGMRRLTPWTAPDELLSRILDETGYQRLLDGRGRANVEKFLGLLARSWSSAQGSLRKAVDELAFLRATEQEPEAPAAASADAVQLMVIHQAKGLEFPVVFVAGLDRATNPSSPNIIFDTEQGLGAKWRHPATGQAAKDAVHRRLSEAAKERERQEEHRLLYVAMTRAEEHLVLSMAYAGRLGGPWARRVLKRFDVAPASPAGPDPVVRRYPGFEAAVRVVDQAPEPPDFRLRSSDPLDEFVWLAPAAPASRHDSAVTVSALAEFERCPRRYYLGMYLGYDGRRPGRAPDEGEAAELLETGVDAGEFGSQVHRLLARLPVPEPSPEALELVWRFERSELGRRAARAARIEREFDFLLALDDIVVRGQIDLWFEEAGELVLVDYKTDDVPAAHAAGHARGYNTQIRLYALALEKAAGRLPDRAWLYLLRPDESVPVELASEDLEAARDLPDRMAAAQSSLHFPLLTGEHCRRCPFNRGLCPAELEPESQMRLF